MAATPKALAATIGERLQQRRLNADLTQADIAKLSGLSRKVVMAAEQGNVKLENLVALLLALGLADQLESFLAAPGPSPIELAKLKGRQRQRASGKRLASDKAPAEDYSPW